MNVIGQPTAERAVLGALLRSSRTTALSFAQHLRLEDFTDPRHRAVLGAVMHVAAIDKAHPDPVLVEACMRRTGAETSLTCDQHAAAFLAELLTAACVSESLGWYARALREHTYRRQVARSATRLAQAARDHNLEDLEVLVEQEHRQTLAAAARLQPPRPLEAVASA